MNKQAQNEVFRRRGYKWQHWPAVVALGLLAAACGQDASLESGPDSTAPAAVEDRLSVYTVNYPLAYFATRIGGDRVEVVFPAPPEGDPAGWAPSGQDIAAFQKADLILLNGAGYAGWARLVSLPADKLVNTSERIADRYLMIGEEATHSHGDDAEHSHEGQVAFTTWLDPGLAIAQAAAIREALSARQPDAAARFQAGFASLKAELEALDQEFEALFAQLGDTPVVFSHPVYQYLQRRYDINGISVHFEPDEMPSDEQMNDLARTLVRHPARMMIWEGDPLPMSVQALTAMDVASVSLDPCGNRPGAGDYMSVMRQNVANLRVAIAQ